MVIVRDRIITKGVFKIEIYLCMTICWIIPVLNVWDPTVLLHMSCSQITYARILILRIALYSLIKTFSPIFREIAPFNPLTPLIKWGIRSS